MNDFVLHQVGKQMLRSPFCLVAVGYNRAEPLERLLRSICAAQYFDARVDLLISIDGSDAQPEIVKLCKTVDWPHGNFMIRAYRENVGLRRHILACGAVTEDYDAVIVLEDDLSVGPMFFEFARAAIDYYGREPLVAGISLYSPTYNEMANLPFEAEVDETSVYALQSAQSWGQCWTKSMWSGFRDWYEHAEGSLTNDNDMPERIYSWPESSWKKFAMKYLAETSKTWIYPRVSHSTNFSEIGEHNVLVNALYQTALYRGNADFSFKPLESLVAYDLYFERDPAAFTGLQTASGESLIVDLYGSRQAVEGPCRLLTIRDMDFISQQSFGLGLRPQERSVIEMHEGCDVHLYDIPSGQLIDLCKFKRRSQISFHINVEWRQALIFGLKGLLNAIVRRARR